MKNYLMKNKLLKGAHLSERKYREILQLFCDDLTATQIAEISGISRVTINSYFKLMRNRIASHDKGITPFSVNEEGVLNQDAGSNFAECSYYGFLVVQDKMQTHLLNDIDNQSIRLLSGISSGAIISNESLPYLGKYHAIADCTSWNLYWMETKQNGQLNELKLFPEINNFWHYTKSRLLKFRGMDKKSLYLHIRECEFRYNFRNEDLYSVLINIINTPDKATVFSKAYNLIS